MKSKIRTTGKSTAEISLPTRTFERTLRLSPLGARLARRLSVGQLAAWGVAYDHPASDTAALIVAELAANAVVHAPDTEGDFHLRLTLKPHETGHGLTLRIAVTDAAADRPALPRQATPSDAVSGRGLLLVAALADAWGQHGDSTYGKTVWAELVLSGMRA